MEKFGLGINCDGKIMTGTKIGSLASRFPMKMGCHLENLDAKSFHVWNVSPSGFNF